MVCFKFDLLPILKINVFFFYNEQARQKQTHRHREQIGGYQRERGLRVGKRGEGGPLHSDG